MVIREGSVDLGQGDVRILLTDFFWRPTLLIKGRNVLSGTLYREAAIRAGGVRCPALRVRRACRTHADCASHALYRSGRRVDAGDVLDDLRNRGLRCDRDDKKRWTSSRLSIDEFALKEFTRVLARVRTAPCHDRFCVSIEFRLGRRTGSRIRCAELPSRRSTLVFGSPPGSRAGFLPLLLC